MILEFHPLVQRDVNEILQRYDEISPSLGDEFFQELLAATEKAADNPRHFHPYSEEYRRANLKRFPYHFLYRELPDRIRVTIVRHNKRHPSYGLKRK